MRGMGRIADSIPLLQQAVELREQALGSEHGSLATLHANLARAQLDTGDAEAAAVSMARALPIAERSFAPDYQVLGHVYAAAAQIAAARAQPEESRRLATPALAATPVPFCPTRHNEL